MITGGVVLLLVLLTAAVRAVNSGAVLPGVRAGDVDLGGLSRVEAAAAIESAQEVRAVAATTLEFEGRTFEVTPEQYGYDLDGEQVAEVAFAIGRDGNVLANTWRHVRSRLGATEVLPLDADIDEAMLGQRIEEIAAEVDLDASIGDLRGNPESLTVEAVAPDRGLVVDRDAAAELLRRAADDPQAVTVELPVEIQEPTVEVAAVEAAARRAEQSIQQPITLFAGTDEETVEVTLSPRQLAGMLTLRPDGDGVAIDTRTEDVELAFADRAGDFEVEAVDATFGIPRDPGVTVDGKAALTWEPVGVNVPITSSQPGRTFDAGLTARQLGDLLADGQNRAAIALREVRANFTREDAEGLGITQLLGTFTTYHACCQARVRNIQKLADLVDGRIVLPGEQFSINQISGERTCASGFFPAGMILNGEIVDSCGGGVSQFGTTTFNAAFFAGLQLDDWKAHSFYISRYPMGREATLNFPSPDIDVKWTNTTGNGILVRTSYTSTSITVSIYGTSDVVSVEATRSGTFAPRGFSTQRRPNPALAPGQEIRVQSGAAGFSVRVNRFVTREDGSVEEREIVTVYSPQREIIEFGPGEPQPQPSPSGSPSPQPSGSPSPQPSSSPSPQPSGSPSPSPSGEPTPEPSPEPSGDPEPASTEAEGDDQPGPIPTGEGSESSRG